MTKSPLIPFLMLLLIAIDSCNTLSKPVNHYNARVSIDWEHNSIAGLTTLKIYKTKDIQSVVFGLSSMYDSITVSSREPISFSIDRHTNKALIIVKFQERNERIVEIVFQYRGTIITNDKQDGFQLLDDEIFPTIEKELNFELFTATIELKSSKNLEFYSNAIIRTHGDTSVLNIQYPTDRALIVFPKVPYQSISQAFPEKKLNLNIIGPPGHTFSPGQIADASSQIIGFYNDLSCENPIRNLNILVNPFNQFPFFCRSGFVNLSIAPSEKALLYALSHEIAHHWWKNAKIKNYAPDAFLNESFAEFYAYIFFRHYYGAGEFNALRQRKQREVADLQYSINHVSPEMDATTRSRILYTKGALILCDLENYVGEDQFHKFLCKLQQKKPETLIDFNSLLKEELGNDALKFLLLKMDKPRE